MMGIERRFMKAIEAEGAPFESAKSTSNGRFVEPSRATEAVR